MYFDWGDYPQIYGSGNCDEERLIRLSTRASRLLNNLFPLDLKAPPESGDIGEYFEALPLDLLLRALSSQVGTVPNIVTPFVPNLVRLLGKSDDTSVGNSIRSLLGAYVSGSEERAKEIEAAQAQYAFININETASANDCLQKGLDYFSGKDYQEAITHFDKVLELNGKAESIDVGLKRKTNIDAIGSAELSKNKSIRHEQNFSAVYHRGIAFSAVGNEDEAICARTVPSLPVCGFFRGSHERPTLRLRSSLQHARLTAVTLRTARIFFWRLYRRIVRRVAQRCWDDFPDRRGADI